MTVISFFTQNIDERFPARAVGRVLDSHARRKFHSPRQGRGRRPIERKLFDKRRISDEEIGDCPLSQDIVTERHAVVSEVSQGLASHESVHCQRRKVADIKRTRVLRLQLQTATLIENPASKVLERIMSMSTQFQWALNLRVNIRWSLNSITNHNPKSSTRNSNCTFSRREEYFSHNLLRSFVLPP